jgi:putative ABC transport system ATP-binding protein
MNEKSAVILTSGLKKTYREDGLEVAAVRGIDLTVRSGDFTALVGPSGSGKTTFLNLISGLDTPTGGEVRLLGRRLAEMNAVQLSDFRRDTIGFIFQAYNLIPVLTVAENIEYVMLLQRIPRPERRRRVAEILEVLGLQGMEKRKPPQLSGGQQQRVAVARAMVSRPALILADEPTANLDSANGSALLDQMRDLNRTTGMTFVFSTHDPMVMERARMVVTMKDGLIAAIEEKG